MTRLASLAVIALLGCACAGQHATPQISANARTAGAAASTPPAAQGDVALRRFYLLAPGPNATLVMTRSDVVSVAH